MENQNTDWLCPYEDQPISPFYCFVVLNDYPDKTEIAISQADGFVLKKNYGDVKVEMFKVKKYQYIQFPNP